MGEAIGDRIRKRRRHQEISQADLAKMLSVSIKTISNWETNAHAPRGAVLNALAEALSTTVAYIMGESDDPGIDAKAQDRSVAPRWPGRCKALRGAGGRGRQAARGSHLRQHLG